MTIDKDAGTLAPAPQAQPDLAMSAPDSDPLAAFTDGQWYSYQAHQSVFFAAFADKAPSHDDLRRLALDLVRHAPQLATGFAAGPDGDLLPATLLDELIDTAQTDDLNAYPDAFSMVADPFYDRPDLPMFRIRAVIRRKGPDEQGRAAALLVLSTHALLEGADSALLSRSKNAGRDLLPMPKAKLGLLAKTYVTITAALMVPVQLAIAAIAAPRTDTHAYRALVVKRERLRRLATRLGIRQRSLMFALVCHALNGPDALFSKRRIFALYTDLDPTHAERNNDEFFRFRMMEAKFPVTADFAAFAQGLDAIISRVEAKDVTFSQAFLNAVFAMHRRLKRRLPFFYPPRIFRFTGFYDIDLSLVPPHRLQGGLTAGLMPPVFCGTHHPGLQSCIFVPNRNEITFNFNMSPHLLERIPAISALLDQLEPA